MKCIYFLLVVFGIISMKLHAQQDKLTVSDTLQQPQKDSIHPVIGRIVIDSVPRLRDPWGYPPPCIVPPLWQLDTINWSSFVYFPTIVFNSPYNKDGAKAAIKAGKPLILFPGGIGGMPDFSSKKDKDFQKKYQVKFFSQGCTHLGENENEEAYNQVIFEYLDQKYGHEWRYELPGNAVGFEAPERINLKAVEASLMAISTSRINWKPYLGTKNNKYALTERVIIKVVTVSMVLLLILYLFVRYKRPR